MRTSARCCGIFWQMATLCQILLDDHSCMLTAPCLLSKPQPVNPAYWLQCLLGGQFPAAGQSTESQQHHQISDLPCSLYSTQPLGRCLVSPYIEDSFCLGYIRYRPYSFQTSLQGAAGSRRAILNSLLSLLADVVRTAKASSYTARRLPLRKTPLQVNCAVDSISQPSCPGRSLFYRLLQHRQYALRAPVLWRRPAVRPFGTHIFFHIKFRAKPAQSHRLNFNALFVYLADKSVHGLTISASPCRWVIVADHRPSSQAIWLSG